MTNRTQPGKDRFDVAIAGDDRWASDVSETVGCKLARVAGRLGRGGVRVVRRRDGALMTPIVRDGVHLLLAPAESERDGE